MSGRCFVPGNGPKTSTLLETQRRQKYAQAAMSETLLALHENKNVALTFEQHNKRGTGGKFDALVTAAAQGLTFAAAICCNPPIPCVLFQPPTALQHEILEGLVTGNVQNKSSRRLAV